ncbi:MAG: hypothetical protein JOZ86_13770 [Candidatus Eremiobacteraeota bacterium]|nr:hypothetical protein [Candidatus Eremiobacteraeota bacterium]
MYRVASVLKRIALLVIAMSLAACSMRHSVVPEPGAQLPGQPVVSGDYRITLGNVGARIFKGVTLSRKVSRGETWISIRGANFDQQLHARAVTEIARIDGPNLVSISVNSLPIRNRVPGSRIASLVDRSSCIDPSSVFCNPGCDASQATCPLCPDCMVPVGVNEDGSGVGTIREFGDGFACDFDLSGGGVDCYSSADNPSPPVVPRNLYISYTLTAIDATLVCKNPPEPGWSTALYGDPNQRGGAKKNNIPPAPGSNTWAFPYDFFDVNIGEVFPPTKPSILNANYYHWGIQRNGDLTQLNQGWCRSTG